MKRSETQPVSSIYQELNTINRRLIWPFLLGLNAKEINEKPVYEWLKGDEASLQFDVMKKDSERSLVNLQTYEFTSQFHMVKKQKAILAALNSLFKQNQEINYLQGFHLIAAVLLTLFDNSTGYYLIKTLSTTYFYDFLTFDFKEVAENLSAIIYEVLVHEDAAFKKYLHYYETKRMLTFIIPWMVTWFAHSISSLKAISRIWDYILCTGPTAILFLSAGMILSSKKQLQLQFQTFSEAGIHEFFQQKVKKQQLDVEELIETALLLEHHVQISKLQSYKKLHPKSKFRADNFSKLLPIHVEFHQKRLREIQTNNRISTIAKVGGFALVLATAFLIKKHGKVSWFKQ